ncbi:phenylacetate--CoA ligase family protein [Nitrosomonas sp. JL21]|uniref:phenylacetate--CoA ligase family protein n=1 Tax=Nitrosomonas sp. JL21 TaxID=153949 RepID=UPI00136D14B9|nr:phenylacetate--CoA ligase family protein [Nitrosomonas sp. JL21]MXS79185.1 phenylacetate--CoA ligase family protein [Nitrosomonas sp. JL21]
MNKFIAKYLCYLPVQYLRGQNVKKFLQLVNEDQNKSLSEITNLRDRKLQQIIHTAYKNIPYYMKMFEELNISPRDIQCIFDLQKLPVLSKREVLENEKELIDPNFSDRLFLRKTGGSTGMTLHFMREGRALALNDAIMFRCYDWYNVDIGDRQVRFWGVPVAAWARRKEQFKDFLANRIRISAFDISKSSCLKQYKKIKEFKPTYFYGYTTAIYGFCLFMKESGICLDDLNLKAVICTAEKMYPHHRKLFDEAFNCPVVDEYGSSENGIIAFQCRKGNMHIMSDNLCVEFLDENDNPVAPGQPGRVVVTDLSCHAMPLIRYDIGDIGKPSVEKCSCGIELPLMEMVEGRKEDFIRKKNGELVHAAYLCYTLKEDTVHEFKMYQKETDWLNVQIVKSPFFTDASERKLEENLRSALGKDVRITFEYLDQIPREKSGKLRYFVSELSEHV